MQLTEQGVDTAQDQIPAPPVSRLDRFFRVTQRGSTLLDEVRGGTATFFAMSYIVVLNPLIIGTAADGHGLILGIPSVAAATALVAGVMTIMMGLVGRYPFAIATGLGLNAFVATSLAPHMTWADVMGMIVIEGIVITVLVLTAFRTAVFNAIPNQLKTSIAVGIGLFIAFIGFVDGGFIHRVPDSSHTTVPVELGTGGNLASWPVFVFAVGLLFMALLVARRVKGAIIIGIVVNTIIALIVQYITNVGPSVAADGHINPHGWSLVVPKLPEHILQVPSFGRFGHVDLFGALTSVGPVAVVLFVFTLILSDFFDAMGTVVGLGTEAGLLNTRGQLPGIGRVFFVDGIAAIGGGVAFTSSNTVYVESAAGIGEGARTGLASIVTGMLFLLAMFFSPLVSVVPFEAASPALVIVGFLMLAQIRAIDFTDYDIAIPAFLTIAVMPFTYSIANGIGAGFVSYTIIKILRGRAKDLHILMFVISALFAVYFLVKPIEYALHIR